MADQEPRQTESIASVDVNAEEKGKGELKHVGGSMSDKFNEKLLTEAIRAQWLPNQGDDENEKDSAQATLDAMAGIQPQDEIEGMIAAQLLAIHAAAMECHRRAMVPKQTHESYKQNLLAADRASRTFASMLDALNKHRGKGQQKVTVEHVHVHQGGQAIVGHVEHQGGVTSKIEDQPHAKQITDASESPLRCKDEEGLPVSITSSKG